MTIHNPALAGLALLGYSAALGVFLKWATGRAETLPADNARGLSDAEADEWRLVNGNDIHGEP